MTVRKRQDTVGVRWQASWKDPEGKRRTKDFSKKIEAENFEKQMVSSVVTSSYASPQGQKTNLKVVYTNWLESPNELTPKTKVAYESLWRCLIEQKWSKRPLSSISRADIKNWVSKAESTTGNKVGASRIRQAYVLLNLLLDHAVDMGLIARNPAHRDSKSSSGAFLPKLPLKKDLKPLEIPDLIRLAEKAGSYKLAILLAGLVGLRWAEVIALTPSDIDFKNSEIRVNKSLTEVNGSFTLKSTKSGKVRSLPIPELIEVELRELVLATPADSSLFRSIKGESLRHSNFARRVFTPALKESGLEKITFHDLRHTAISQAISSGMNMLVISQIAGHSNPSFTLSVYGHLRNEWASEFKSKMDYHVNKSICDRSATDQENQIA